MPISVAILVTLLSVLMASGCSGGPSLREPSNEPFVHGALRVSYDGRFLVHEDGTPFPYFGDTAWQLFHRLDSTEVKYYLADRQAKGFTVIQACILAELNGLDTPNRNGDLPLFDNDPTRPNEAYFAWVDFVIQEAAAHGLYVGLLPTWGDKVNDIVADIVKRMLIQEYLEVPLGKIFNEYKEKWFPGGKFVGIDAVIDSMTDFANDLNGSIDNFQVIWDSLPDDIKNMFNVTSDATREASEKGIASASQESVDELNGRATAIQGHTYSINENTKLLVTRAAEILESVLHIEQYTESISERMKTVEENIKDVRTTLNDIDIKGVKMRV